MDAASTSEASVNFYQTIRRIIPEDSHLHTHRRENLKSHLFRAYIRYKNHSRRTVTVEQQWIMSPKCNQGVIFFIFFRTHCPRYSKHIERTSVTILTPSGSLLSDWLAYWVIDWLTEWLIGFIEWLIGFIEWLTGLPSDWLAYRVTGRIYRVTAWLIEWLPGLSSDCLAYRVTDWLIEWLTGLSSDWQTL
jgi:hypothetical protein